MTDDLLVNIFLDGYFAGCQSHHKEVNIENLKQHLKRITNNNEILIHKVLRQNGLK